MKILLVADREERALWGAWSEDMRQRLSDVSLILSAGDLDPAYLEFLVTMLNVPLVYVRGNHDGCYDEKPPEGCISADGRIIEAAGLRIMGLGGSMRYRPGDPDMYTEAEMRRRTRPLQLRMAADSLAGRGGIDILLTHAPCRGYGDMEDIPHRGFKCFHKILEKYHPKYFVHGHMHFSYNYSQKRETEHNDVMVINAYERYLLEYPLEIEEE